MRQKITFSVVSVFAAVLLVATTVTVLNLASVQGQQGVQSFSAALSGSANKSNSTGTAKFLVNENNSQISYWINVTGIKKINQAHVHNGTTGQDGDIVVSLLSNSKSAKGNATPPKIGFNGNITKGDLRGPMQGKDIPDLITLMGNGSAYVNIHTDKYPKGAIRGEISSSDSEMQSMTTEARNMSSIIGNMSTSMAQQSNNMSWVNTTQSSNTTS
ncbi:MAG: CHRD domain-containing protein [Nitrososphaeraceae archaeon]